MNYRYGECEMNLSKKKLAMCICLATLNLGNNYVGATEATETVEQLKSYNLDEVVITATSSYNSYKKRRKFNGC